MSLTSARIGNCAHAPSGGGAPRMDPSRSSMPEIPLAHAADRWREGRAVIDHHDRGDGCARVLVEKPDQAVDVGKAQREGARGDLRDGVERALARGHLDRQPFGGKMAVVDGQEIGRRGAFEPPVEGEVDCGVLCGERRGRDQGSGEGRQYSVQQGNLHVVRFVTVCSPWRVACREKERPGFAGPRMFKPATTQAGAPGRVNATTRIWAICAAKCSKNQA